MKILFYITAISCLLSFAALAESTSKHEFSLTQKAAALRDDALKGTQAYQWVESLTTEVGPRLAGSVGDKMAVKWAIAKMKALGFDKVWQEPVVFDAWQRGPAQANIISPYPRQLTITALGGSVATPDEGLKAEIVEFENLQQLINSNAEQVKHKIVFINNRMSRSQDASGYGLAVGARSRGAVEAAKKGAVAILIRSIGTDDNRLPHTGAMHYDEKTNKIPAAALANPDADIVHRMLQRDASVHLELHLATRFLKKAHSANVIGEVRGRIQPEQIILLGAHLDSWDLGDGAIDDGAGVAIVMETARRLLQLPKRPKRSVRVVLYANEEFGLIGAKAYLKAHHSELKLHVIAIESDLGADKIWRFDSNTPTQMQPVMEQIFQVLQVLNIERGLEPSHGGPDISVLSKAGVPVAALFQDASRYFDYHHTANDTLDKIEAKNLDQNVAAYMAFSYIMANY